MSGEHINEDDLVYRLRKRAEIRRQIATRKSVQEGKPDRISDLLEEAASELERVYSVIDEVVVSLIIDDICEVQRKLKDYYGKQDEV